MFNLRVNGPVYEYHPGPLYIGNQIVERISSYKLLGVIINENLKQNCYVDYIAAKASRKLYALRPVEESWRARTRHVESLQKQCFLIDRFQNMPLRCGKTFLTVCQIEQSPCKKRHLKSYIVTVRTVKHCRQPTKPHFPTDASYYFLNLWLR